MKSNKSITIVIVDTDCYKLGLSALETSLSKLHADRVLVLSDDEKYWKGFPVHRVDKITHVHDYNNLVINELPKLIETDYVLIIQFDGFILHADSFDNNFFNFDYIGAPWVGFPYLNVGNGGFSWRSRRLCEAVSKLNYGSGKRLDNHEAEDLFICRTNRIYLENYENCRFANFEIASRFSVEHTNKVGKPFGFHGLHHLVELYGDKNIELLLRNLSPRVLRSDLHFNLLKHGMRNFKEESVKMLLEARAAVLE